MEVVGVFVLIVVGTYVYTLREALPLLPPFVVLTCAVFLAGGALCKYYQREMVLKKTDEPAPRSLDMLPAGCVWIVWILYGIVFRDVAPLVTSWAAYAHGGAVVLIVLATYWKDDIRDNGKWANGVLVAIAVLLFIPHPDTIGHDMHPALLFGKVGVFYLLFLLSEIALKLESDARRASNVATSPSNLIHPYAVEIQVVQSAWVLLTLHFLMIVALAQMFLVLLDIARHLKRRAAASELPVQNDKSAVNGMRRTDDNKRRHRRSNNRRRRTEPADDVVAVAASCEAEAEDRAHETINNVPISLGIDVSRLDGLFDDDP